MKDHQAIDILQNCQLFAFKRCRGRRVILSLCEGKIRMSGTRGRSLKSQSIGGSSGGRNNGMICDSSPFDNIEETSACPPSVDEGSSTRIHQSNEPRGSNLNKNIPENRGDRKLIHIRGESNYVEKGVVPKISKNFKALFVGQKTQWKHMDANLKDNMYKLFEDQFTYETEMDKRKSRLVWEKRASKLCRGIWAKERTRCIEETGSRNPANWKDRRPEFVYERDWIPIIESWQTNKWRKLSEQGAKNRASVPGEEPNSFRYVRHTGGSIPFDRHFDKMEAELGRKPNQLEFFGRVHRKQKGAGDWCNPRAKNVADQYQTKITEKRLTQSDPVADEGSSSQPSFDPEAWAEVVGGPKKNYIYGFGLTQKAEDILGSTVCSRFTSASKRNSTFHSLTHEEEEARIDAKVEEKVQALLPSLQEQIRAEMEVALLPSLEEKIRVEMEEVMEQRIRDVLATISVSTFQRPSSS